MGSNMSVTATFDLDQETLTVSQSGTATGEITSAPAGIDCGTACSAHFGYGTTVTLSAVPPLHGIFDGWSGACTGTGACTVTTNGATSVTAKFSTTGGPPPLKPCLVPNVKGKTLGKAKSAMKTHYCRVGKINHAFSSKVKKGHVISQKPKAHKRLKHGAKVNLVLSRGRR
jgi:hypothetical protein